MVFLRTLLFVAVVVAIVIGILRLTLIRWWQIPSDDPQLSASLAPGLSAGDWVLLWRGTEPNFTSLVLCDDPANEGEIVIGRILGEGGDSVVAKGNIVSVNGSKGYSPTTCEPAKLLVESPDTGEEVELRCSVEEFGSTWYHKATLVGGSAQAGFVDTQVEPNHVFLISDNRVFPFDSRHFGPVPRASCEERVFFRLWSADGFGDAKNRFDFIR
jgi:signal peptidase I